MDKKQNLFDFENFYKFYKSLGNEHKKILKRKIGQECRMTSDQQVRNWISQKTIPFPQTRHVTDAVKKIADSINMEPNHITEKMLFPHLEALIEEYSVYA